MEYVKGVNNAVVDALSRRPHINNITIIFKDWKGDIIAEYDKDPQTHATHPIESSTYGMI